VPAASDASMPHFDFETISFFMFNNLLNRKIKIVPEHHHFN
jgi:hypothetical protein